jgi:thioredoxin reductase (NADPH)
MDCLVIGGGPAGLTAALYLARFRRSCIVVDAGASRASWIPVSHNQAGFPEGIPGTELVGRMRRHSERYGAAIVAGNVERLERRADRFVATMQDGSRHEAERVLLATGTVDNAPPLPLVDLHAAVQRGLVRYCPICDAHEVIGRKLALVGARTCRIHEALLLRGYTADLTVLTLDHPWQLTARERSSLTEAGIAIGEEPVRRLAVGDDSLVVETGHGRLHHFDSLYVALGLRARSDLATALDAAHDDDGALAVDRHQQTSIPGLYAAGDVVQGLAQISVAMGHGAIASTAIHNGLPLRPAGR